ncbi:hypothetical protein DMA15_17420 [Streptomyces sp. WAC 01529]|uniref:hypothetical protein n=1 Tax=Streptomyces sp. WAC 01529 TaxID=2203205 RepID=UPI000F6E0753|nr:hypothetical protein [Streptomyces sp. WAC 01529]AZM54129.1 hypothetical protein DMA15_17420 [Streptomyces sp. WAC 01529]
MTGPYPPPPGPADSVTDQPTIPVAPDTPSTVFGNCTFPVKVSGRTGRANLGFSFRYSLFDGISKSAPAKDGPLDEAASYSSELKITYNS